MTLQSGNKSHTKLFPLHWSCLARSRWCSDSESLPTPLSTPPAQCEHSHATPSRHSQSDSVAVAVSPVSVSAPGPEQALHIILCANSKSESKSIQYKWCSDGRDRRATSEPNDSRPRPPFAALCCLRFSLWPLWRAALGSLSAIAAAYDSSVLPPFCWLALAARTRRGFVALFRLFPFVVFELSALLVWHPLHTDTHNTHTLKLAHTHTRTHAELLTNSAIDWPRFMASIMKSCSSNCDKFDAKKKATTKCQNHLQVNLSSKENT